MVRAARRFAPMLLAGAVIGGVRLAGHAELALLLGLLALAMAAGRDLPRPARLALAVAAAAFALTWPLLRPLAPQRLAGLLPAAGDLLLCTHFGATLRPGREPLISRYTRHDFGHLPPECAGYTRVLTLLWATLFAVLAPLHTLLLLGLPPLAAPLGSGTVLGGTAAFMLFLFLGEHVIRTLRFPQFGLATPARTLRAILSAHLSRHA
ncbi:hypothetical protein E0493_12815 [Roseomonas sp. M0104]|uniref:Uncharacterized protein n=1 Tax=Teichococcus coralli TaxID=2545983 RepID=A0A845BDM8_9PROT|nr:hypothetical protein [Pseudoroseomonas coralli]MXP64226.1 hypothetical protein [Pseudoroseomonas coralli]